VQTIPGIVMKIRTLFLEQEIWFLMAELRVLDNLSQIYSNKSTLFEPQKRFEKTDKNVERLQHNTLQR
jgi:hypothetical protein